MDKTTHNPLYDTPQWRNARKAYLNSHPLCVLCSRSGRDTPANTVDHITPHNNSPLLFWDENNWQPLCSSCHSGTKRISDLNGYSQAADKNGLPLDTNHPWNKQTKKG